PPDGRTGAGLSARRTTPGAPGGGSDPHRTEVPPHPRVAARHRPVLSSRLPPGHNQPHARVRTVRIRVRHLRTVQRTAHQSHVVHALTITDAAPRVRRSGRLGAPVRLLVFHNLPLSKTRNRGKTDIVATGVGRAGAGPASGR